MILYRIAFVLLPLQNFACQHAETPSQYGNMNFNASIHETAQLIQSYFLQNKQSWQKIVTV
jgi:hypothetical protein